jgi:hypothetical protein
VPPFTRDIDLGKKMLSPTFISVYKLIIVYPF